MARCRDIAEGDELLIDYGPSWEVKWTTYLDQMVEFHEVLAVLESTGRNLDDLSFDLTPPQFRCSIESPAGMFPASFFVDECLGSIPCDEAGSAHVRGDNRLKQLHGANELQSVLKARSFAAANHRYFTGPSAMTGAEEEEEEDTTSDATRRESTSTQQDL